MLILTTCAFIVLSMPITADCLHAYLNRYPALSIQQIKASDAQAIVLLSGGIYGYADEYQRFMPNENSMLRAIYAAYIAKYNNLPILVSGGGRRAHSPAGGALIQQFMHTALNTEVRWVETQSQTTLENALFSKAYLDNLGIKRIILVTESWHMKRAVFVFERLGVEVLAAPTFESRAHYEFNTLDKFVPTAQAFRRTQTALHEIAGFIWYQFAR